MGLARRAKVRLDAEMDLQRARSNQHPPRLARCGGFGISGMPSIRIEGASKRFAAGRHRQLHVLDSVDSHGAFSHAGPLLDTSTAMATRNGSGTMGGINR